MARYKLIDTSPRFIAVDLERQLIPGTFEHALNHLIDHEIDLSGFDARYCNDQTGAAAYPPGMLLKVVLFAYSRGLVSSRGIERACREHITFIALSGDSAPHYTTLAAFVSGLGDDIAKLFAQILAALCASAPATKGWASLRVPHRPPRAPLPQVVRERRGNARCQRVLRDFVFE